MARRDRLSTITSQVRHEWRSLRATQRTRGLRVGTIEHSRRLLGLDAIASVEDLAAVRHEVGGAEARLAASIERTQARSISAINMAARVDTERERRALHEQVAATMTFLDLTASTTATTVTVVLPTRDRPQLLRRAIESVLRQQHAPIELIVVDDSPDGSAKEVISSFDDRRLVAVQTPGVGAYDARNAALDRATGAVVAYLDDDNVMHPGWLRAVAWAFDRWPETDVVYGARIFEDSSALLADDRNVPTIQIEPWDRHALEADNFIDLNVLAHRREIAGARFDEQIPACADWDLALRLTEAAPPRALPHVAVAYTTDAAARITGSPSSTEGAAIVRERLRARRALRVLFVESQFPLLSETYIDEDRRALIDAGADVAVYRAFPTIAPAPDVGRAYTDLERAVAAHRPEVALVHWADFALGSAHRLVELGLPFAVRCHSFDFSVANVTDLASHPWCVGVWVHEHMHAEVAGLAVSYRPLLWPPPAIPDPPPARDLVLSVSAGLPKKDWPTLLGALATLAEAGVDARAIAGFSLGLEDVPGDIARLLSSYDQAPLVQLNVPRADVFALLPRTALLVYTLAPEATMGTPMSVIEGLCAGASVVVPDRRGVHAIAGPSARTYRTQADIVRHALEALAGGPDVDAERAANREFGLRTYADSDQRLQLAHDLAAMLDRWERPEV